MPRDYKNINKNKNGNNKTGKWLSVIITFCTGLAVGLFMAFLIFMYYQEYLPRLGSPVTTQADEPKVDSQGEDKTLPKPKFDFYKILPDREVNISEWVAEGQDKEIAETNEASMYVLQVGSFKKYSAADQVKARLALMGINSEIQRVVINGQDVRHRVRIGPYKNSTQLNEARQRLRENDLDFMILKLKLDEKAAG